MRAVSSPSLTENTIELPSASTSPHYSTKPEPNVNVLQNHEHLNERGNNNGKLNNLSGVTFLIILL